jgi:uncharacterized protein
MAKEKKTVKKTTASEEVTEKKSPSKGVKKTAGEKVRVTKKTDVPKGSNGTVDHKVSPIAEIDATQFQAIEQDQRDLPLEYDDTRIVLMVRDPEWVYAYWSISEKDRERFELSRDEHDQPLILRIQESLLSGSEQIYDVPVNDFTSSWYLRVNEQTGSAKITLGINDKKGVFITLAVSNQVCLPKIGIAPEEDLQFAEIDDETYHQIVKLSGGVRIGERLGSDEFLRSLQQRLYDNLNEGFGGNLVSSGENFGMFSGMLGGASAYFSGSLVPSSYSSYEFGAGGKETVTGGSAQAQEREFWLEVGVDVIVYGATSPDAKVTFMGKPVKLTPDGTFRFRMVLPDTEVEFPVVAISVDGEETRQVKPIVTRITEGNPHDPV